MTSIPKAGSMLPSLPTVPSFFEADEKDRPHQGLLRLDQACTLLEEGNVVDIKELLVDALEEYVQVAHALVEGETDKKAIQDGLPKVLSVYIRAEEALPEALHIIRWFCSAHMICLEKVAYDVASQSVGWRMTTEPHGERGESEAALTDARSLRMLRLLMSGFGSFLNNARSKLFCNEYHMKHLERAVGHTREAVKSIAEDCAGPAPIIGKAAARLKGMVVTACFTRLHNAAYDNVQPAGNQMLFKWGHKDLSNLLKCISTEGNQGPTLTYLQTEGNCIEALGALRSLAIAASQVYPMIVTAFADAIKCMDAASRGQWGNRPALKNITVRHTLIACAAHLADRVGRTPDRVRQGAFHKLWAALSDCCIMQTGQYVYDQLPWPNTAGARAISEAYNSGTNPGSPRSSTPTVVIPGQGEGIDKSAAKGGRSSASSTGSLESSWQAASRAGSKRPRSPRSSTDSHPVREPSRSRSPFDENALDSRPARKPTRDRDPSEGRADVVLTGGNKSSGEDVRDSKKEKEEPPPLHPSTIVVEDSNRGVTKPTDSLGKTAPTSRSASPITVPGERPDWTEGKRYQVVLGESFERDVDLSRNEVDDSSDVGHYVRLKYDFVPGRTDLDASATLKQRPLGGSVDAKGAKSRHATDERRWTAEMEYRSRDPSNSRPVRFDGDIARAQDVECVLVFDGNMFVMDRVSVIGGLKYVQDVKTLPKGGGRSIGEVSLNKRDKPKKEKNKKDRKDKKERKENADATKDKKKRSKEDSDCGERKKSNGQLPKVTEEGDQGTSRSPMNNASALIGPEKTARVTIARANMLSRPTTADDIATNSIKSDVQNDSVSGTRRA